MAIELNDIQRLRGHRNMSLPRQAPLCMHGNPNVLTKDVGTSFLAQGCSGQLTVVQIERFDEPLQPIRAYDPP